MRSMTHFYSLISLTLYLQFLVEGNMVFGVGKKTNNKESKKESHSKYNGKQPKFELTSVAAPQGKKTVQEPGSSATLFQYPCLSLPTVEPRRRPLD